MNSRNQRRASRARQSPLDVAKEYVRKGTDQAGFVVKTVSDAVGMYNRWIYKTEAAISSILL